MSTEMAGPSKPKAVTAILPEIMLPCQPVPMYWLYCSNSPSGPGRSRRPPIIPAKTPADDAGQQVERVGFRVAVDQEEPSGLLGLGRSDQPVHGRGAEVGHVLAGQCHGAGGEDDEPRGAGSVRHAARSGRRRARGASRAAPRPRRIRR
ncbi:hypothetical protein SBADM41S_09413 [Streptomyces badius]